MGKDGMDLDYEMKRFLDALVACGGEAKSSACPSATREQDKARKKAKDLGYVERVARIGRPDVWAITDAGRAALTKQQ